MSAFQVKGLEVFDPKSSRGAAEGWPPGIMLIKTGVLVATKEICAGWHWTTAAGVAMVGP